MAGTVLPVCCPPLGAGHYRCAAYNRVAGPKRDATGLAAALLPGHTGKRAVKAARFNACFGALQAWYSALPSPEPSVFRLIGSIGNLGRFKFQNRVLSGQLTPSVSSAVHDVVSAGLARDQLVSVYHMCGVPAHSGAKSSSGFASVMHGQQIQSPLSKGLLVLCSIRNF